MLNNIKYFICVHLILSIINFLLCLIVKVVDCRVCGDPNSVLRFAFVEFTDEGMLITCSCNRALVRFHKSQLLTLLFPLFLAEGARNALSLAGTMLGFYPVRVLPSKTAIAPVNPTFLPRVRFLFIFGYFVKCCFKLAVVEMLISAYWDMLLHFLILFPCDF